MRQYGKLNRYLPARPATHKPARKNGSGLYEGRPLNHGDTAIRIHRKTSYPLNLADKPFPIPFCAETALGRPVEPSPYARQTSQPASACKFAIVRDIRRDFCAYSTTTLPVIFG